VTKEKETCPFPDQVTRWPLDAKHPPEKRLLTKEADT